MNNLIETTTNKWFEEAADLINSNVTTDTSIDNLLSGVVPLTNNYCKAVFLLANNNFKLQAMALLRILGELALRLIWCFYSDNPKQEPPEVRIERWIKTTNDVELKLLRKVLPSVDEEKAEEIKLVMEFLQKEIENSSRSFIGPFYNSLDELPSDYKRDIYPLLYGAFNRAIHPNLKLLGDLIKQENGRRIFLSDLEEVEVDVLKIYSMTAAFNILAIVHLHYEWNYEGLKSEYLSVKKELADKRQQMSEDR